MVEFVPDRQRDVLPLPLGPSLDAALAGHSALALSGGQKRRARHRRSQEVWLKEGIQALNELGGEGVAPAEHLPLNSAQRSAVGHLAKLYGDIIKPEDEIDPLRAWMALQGQRPGYTDESVADSGFAVYRRGAVSLPQEGAGKVPLENVLPPVLQSLLVDDGDLTPT